MSEASRGGLLPSAILAAVLAVSSLGSPARAVTATTERSFATAEQAVAALVDAVRANDPQAIYAVLGPGSEKLVSSGDRVADAAARQHFLQSYAEHHTLEPGGPGRMLLDVGNNDWQLPIPIVETAGRWRFDSAAGAEELVDRRIGRNEILAIRTMLACVDAENEFFALTGREGHAEYAQHFISTPGERDGLYWPATSPADESPLGPLVATAEEEGYPGERVSGKPSPYQGYYFRILKSQGAYAPGGAKDYVKDGRMTEGFALVAWPASYGASGIMTFIVDQGGIVFQKDLGPDTASAAAAITSFDPDLSWTRVEVVNR